MAKWFEGGKMTHDNARREAREWIKANPLASNADIRDRIARFSSQWAGFGCTFENAVIAETRFFRGYSHAS